MTGILLIDDEPRVSRALDYALADRDFELLAVSDATDLDALSMPQVPDVILLDIALAHQDGLEICRQLRADPRFREVTVLMLSGQTDAASLRAWVVAGADDF